MATREDLISPLGARKDQKGFVSLLWVRLKPHKFQLLYVCNIHNYDCLLDSEALLRGKRGTGQSLRQANSSPTKQRPKVRSQRMPFLCREEGSRRYSRMAIQHIWSRRIPFLLMFSPSCSCPSLWACRCRSLFSIPRQWRPKIQVLICISIRPNLP